MTAAPINCVNRGLPVCLLPEDCEITIHDCANIMRNCENSKNLINFTYFCVVHTAPNINCTVSLVPGCLGHECYVCHEQDQNKGKCTETVEPCDFEYDHCLSEIGWGSKCLIDGYVNTVLQ